MEPAEDSDPETAAQIRERERERLRKMTFYCFTSDCLRDYILRYFGEYGDSYCGNCSNCLTKFEELDITQTARNLISFIRESPRPYGLVTVTDALHGSGSSKILRAGLNRNPYYGKLRFHSPVSTPPGCQPPGFCTTNYAYRWGLSGCNADRSGPQYSQRRTDFHENSSEAPSRHL